MKRLGRVVRRTLLAAGLLVLGLWLLYSHLLPWAGQRTLRRTLSDAGLAPRTLNVVRLTPWELDLGPSELGPTGGLRVHSLQARYSPARLRASAIDTLHIRGARLEMSLRDGRLDPGPLATLLNPTAAAPPRWPADLPFSRIRIDDAQVVIDWHGQPLHVPVRATIDHQGGGTLTLDVSLQSAGIPMHVVGRITPDSDTAMRLQAQVSIAGQVVQITGRYDLASGRALFDGLYEAAGWRLAGQLRDASLRLDASPPAGRGQLQSLHLTAARADDNLELNGRLTGRDWQIDGLNVRLPLHPAHWHDALAGRLGGEFSIADAGPLVELLAESYGVRFERCPVRLSPRQSPAAGGSVNEPAPEDSVNTDDTGFDRPAAPQPGPPHRAEGERSGPRLSLAGRFNAHWQPGGVNRPPNWRLAVDPLRVTLDAAVATLPAQGLRMENLSVIATGSAVWTADGPSLAGTVAWSAGARLDRDDLEAHLPVIEGDALVHADLAAVRVEQGLLRARNVDLVHLVSGLRIEDASIEIPLERASAGDSQGSLCVAALRWADLQVRDLVGTCALHDGTLRWQAAAPDAAAPRLRTQGELALHDGQPRGQVRASLLDLRLDDPRRLGGWFRAARDFDLTGAFDLHAVLSLEAGRLSPWLTVEAREAAFVWPAMNLRANGVEAVVNMDRLDPPGTPPWQWVTARSVQWGRLNLADGLVQFHVTSPRALLIERTSWRLGEQGRFWVHGFWVDPSQPELDLEVFIEDADIRDLLALAVPGKVAGQGLIYGRVPLVVRPGRTPMVTPGRGFLYAQPGGGWFEVRDRSAVASMLSQSDAELSDQLRQRVVDALSNFSFSRLKVELRDDPQGAMLRIETQGKGRSGADAQEFASLIVNVRGLQGLLDLILTEKKD